MSELTPITRKETFLAKVGGQNVVTPTPITREETFLQDIIDNGSGGGGGTGGGVLVCTKDTQSGALDKTWNEIASSSFAIIKSAMEGATFIHNVSIIFSDDEGYGVGAFNYYGQDIDYEMYIANSADGYPVKAG